MFFFPIFQLTKKITEKPTKGTNCKICAFYEWCSWSFFFKLMQRCTCHPRKLPARSLQWVTDLAIISWIKFLCCGNYKKTNITPEGKWTLAKFKSSILSRRLFCTCPVCKVLLLQSNRAVKHGLIFNARPCPTHGGSPCLTDSCWNGFFFPTCHLMSSTTQGKLMKHIQMGKYPVIYHKRAAVLFQKVLWFQCATLSQTTNMVKNPTSIRCHKPNRELGAQGNLPLRMHDVKSC